MFHPPNMIDRTRISACRLRHRQRDLVNGLYQASWSDVFVAWMHIKAMRLFVESVLRFGMPPSFAAFILSPKGDQTLARKSLAETLGKQAGGLSASMAETAAGSGRE